MGAVKFDSIEKEERIEFNYFEKLHYKNIQVADSNDYLYLLSDLEAVQCDLKEYFYEQVQALFDSYELHNLFEEFQEESLDALTEMIAENGPERYSLKVWEGGKFQSIKE